MDIVTPEAGFKPRVKG